MHPTSSSQLSTASQAPQADSDVELMLTNPSPQSSPPPTKHSPFHSSDDTNPFLSSDQHTSSADQYTVGLGEKGLKHCISDTNLNQLKQEYKPLHLGDHLESLITRSEEDLTATVGMEESLPRHCVAKPAQQARPSPKSATAKKNHTEDNLSKSLFFVKLEDSDWVTLDREDHKRPDLSSLRQVRSTETSPTQGRKTRSKYGAKHKLEFLNPSGIRAITSKVNMHSPELSGRNNRKALAKSRDRSRSAAVVQALGKSSQWVSRYRPGVAVPIQGETPRENIMQSELRHREKEFCTPVQLRWVRLCVRECVHTCFCMCTCSRSKSDQVLAPQKCVLAYCGSRLLLKSSVRESCTLPGHRSRPQGPTYC